MKRHVVIGQVLVGISWFSFSLFAIGCDSDLPGGGNSVAPATVGGQLNVGDFEIPAGAQTVVTSDVEIVASGDVVIEGELIAETNPNGQGYSISIVADGDIVVGGTIQAGEGTSGSATSAKALPAGAASKVVLGATTNMPGEGGGSLNLISNHGNLTIRRNSILVGVSGSDGSEGTLGARGGRGGSVSLCAPYGRLTVRGSISLGDGGNGGDANVDTDTLATILPASAVLNIFDFTNAGGDGGRLFAFAATWDWPGMEFYNSAGSPALDPVAYAADLSSGVIMGGVGGNAGLVSVMDDTGTKFYAQLTRQWDGGGDAPYQEKFTITAADGGRGWTMGGGGGSITVIAGQWSGLDGVAFEARAGHGGDVGTSTDVESDCGTSVPAIGAVGGLGGSAVVTGPAGVPVVIAGGTGDGGAGGKAIAVGGRGGTTLTDILQTGGTGGSAIAVAGAGADGRSSCFSGSVGNGGNGGLASSFGGSGGDGEVRGEGGIANSIAGIGGRGGDGGSSAGSGGVGGDALTKFGGQGTTGQSGDVVEDGAEFTEKADDGEAGLANALVPPDVCDSLDYECPNGPLCGG